MKKLVTSLSLCLVIAWPAVAPAQTLDPATEAATKKLFDGQAIGVELKLQGEYIGKYSDKSDGAQVVARGDKSFHALILEGGLPGDGWDGAQPPARSRDRGNRPRFPARSSWFPRG